MTVPGVCPSCGAKFPLTAALQDAQARRALGAALRLAPSLADRILAYMDLFSPGDRRAIRMDRLARLLDELAAPIRAAEVERKGRYWSAPLDYWERAFDQVLAARERLTLPLRSHGYLFEIVVGIAAKAEARRETHREERRRDGYEHDRQGTGLTHVSATAKQRPRIPPEIEEYLRRRRKGRRRDGGNDEQAEGKGQDIEK